MFGQKMYKKGLADGLAANLPLTEKQKAAIEHVRKEIKEGKDPLLAMKSLLEEDIGNIYKYLTAKEKTLLYKLVTPFDIKAMEEGEKKLLVSILYQLADDECGAVTDAQRLYVRSVQQYLQVANPAVNADLQAVENIDSLEQQKAFMQIALEFFYLQDSDTLTEQQAQFLEYFSVKPRDVEVIERTVSQIYNTIGPDGLASHYGPVPVEEAEEEEEKEPWPTDLTGFEEISISDDIAIAQGEEKIFQKQIVHIRAAIACEGTLIFENCVLHYGEQTSGRILVEKTGTLQIRKCRIEDHQGKKVDPRRNIDKNDFFITVKQAWEAVVLEQCEFISARAFLYTGGRVTLKKSRVIDPGEGFLRGESDYGIGWTSRKEESYFAITDCSFIFSDWKNTFENLYNNIIKCQTINFVRCEVTGELTICTKEEAKNIRELSRSGSFLNWFMNVTTGRIVQCYFSGMNRVCKANSSFEIQHTLCEHCSDFCGSGQINITDCRFERCTAICYTAQIKHCQFNDCYLELVRAGFTGLIEDCEFNNWEGEPSGNNKTGAFSSSSAKSMLRFNGFGNHVTKCAFNGMKAHDSFLIVAETSEKIGSWVVEVKNCQFLNCKTDRTSKQLIKLKDTYLGAFKRVKDQTVVLVTDCQGLDKVNCEGDHNDDVQRMLTNATGEHIGVENTTN